MPERARASPPAWQAAFAAALLDPERPPPPELVAWNGSDPAARFAVYRNNVVTSLITALEETFPVTRALVGEEFFAAMAKEFVRASPPATPVLAAWGHDLPAFIEGFAPARGVPYLADVARLEALRVRAYHAADAQALARGELEALLADPDRLPGMRVELLPSAAWLASEFAVVSLWAAHQASRAELAGVDPFAAEEALVVRPELAVEVHRLPPGGADFVALLAGGAALADAAAAAAARHGAFDLSGVLAIMIRARVLSRVQTEGGVKS
ncbi:MAG: DNA-binding domain-containing protein [Gammaproteobacteria bacterium]|nr:DNA-binding domain-containing protein [Gammaproteobacteria bacterium]